jgi:uncharacterized Zn finger protein
MRISIETPEHRFLVESDSGARYHITFAGSPDEHVNTWSCDCPAGSHGRPCKHIRAFLASRLMDVEAYDPDPALPTSITV